MYFLSFTSLLLHLEVLLFWLAVVSSSPDTVTNSSHLGLAHADLTLFQMLQAQCTRLENAMTLSQKWKTDKFIDE
jgi:hypothetical protein